MRVDEHAELVRAPGPAQRDRAQRPRTGLLVVAGRVGGALEPAARRVGIDEAHLEPLAAVALDEQELVALGVGALDDRPRERREEVALHGPPQRPCSELGSEALVEQELDRGLVPLDGPFAAAQPASLEHGGELGPQQLAHDRAGQRAERDDPVEAVDELGPERARDLPLDGARREVRAPASRSPGRHPSAAPSRRSTSR